MRGLVREVGRDDAQERQEEHEVHQVPGTMFRSTIRLIRGLAVHVVVQCHAKGRESGSNEEHSIDQVPEDLAPRRASHLFAHVLWDGTPGPVLVPEQYT